MVVDTNDTLNLNKSRDANFFELIATHTFDLIMLLAEDGKILYHNSAVERIFGYYSDKLDGYNSFDLIHPEDRPNVREQFFNVISVPEKEVTIECRVLHANGSWRFMEVKGQNFLENYQLSGILINARDITEKKQQEFEISQLNKRLELAFQTGVMAWWELELPSGKVRFHENMTKMLGYKQETFTHYSHFMELVHPEDRELTLQAVRDHVDGKEPIYECNYRIMDSSGNYLWFRAIGKVTFKNGDYVLMNGIASDLSQEKSGNFP